jgi:hypothetical protein
MKPVLEITGTRDGTDVPALAAILDVIEPEGSGLAWALFYLDATSAAGVGGVVDDLSLADLKARSEAPTGIRLSWQEFRSLVVRLDQVVWGAFAGFRKGYPEPNYRTDPEFRSVELVIEAVDGGYWEVYTTDRQLLDRFLTAFPGRARFPQVQNRPAD